MCLSGLQAIVPLPSEATEGRWKVQQAGRVADRQAGRGERPTKLRRGWFLNHQVSFHRLYST